VVAVGVIVVVVFATQVPIPKRVSRRQTSLAKTAQTEETTPVPSLAVATPTPASTLPASPSASATTSATPTGTPSPQASPTLAATPSEDMNLQLIKESNGMSIGCEPGSIDQYLTCEVKEPGGFSMTFYFFLPKNYNPDADYPLVMLMEGGGERSDPTKTEDENRDTLLNDPYAQIWGPGFDHPYSQDVQGKWPCFVVIPQLKTPDRFVDVDANHGSYTMAPEPNDSMRMSKEILDTLQLAYHNIDRKRIYLTGLSMGGYGAWEAAERWPDYFAAVVPIAGAGDPTYASRLVHLPIWAFHSVDDTTVPVSGSRDMIQAIDAAGGLPRYTEYTDQGHGAWLAPFTILEKPTPTPDFFSWLFAQHK
jgi:predicted peptidase